MPSSDAGRGRPCKETATRANMMLFSAAEGAATAMKTVLSSFLACAVAGLLATVSCAGDHAPPTPTQDVTCVVNSIVVTPPSATLHPGDTLLVHASRDYCPGEPTTSYQWRSSNLSVATVTTIGPHDGVVRSVAIGNVTIIATATIDPSINGAAAIVVAP